MADGAALSCVRLCPASRPCAVVPALISARIAPPPRVRRRLPPRRSPRVVPVPLVADGKWQLKKGKRRELEDDLRGGRQRT
jgi:hypothetical protein